MRNWNHRVYIIPVLIFAAPVLAQSFLEPAPSIWDFRSARPTTFFAAATDTLLRGFAANRIAQCVCLPGQGQEWAISLERTNSTRWIIRANVPRGSLGMSSIEDPVQIFVQIASLVVDRYSKPIDSERGEAIKRVFTRILKQTRYAPKSERSSWGSVRFYFSVERRWPQSYSGVADNPEPGTPPHRLCKLAFRLMKYATSPKSSDIPLLKEIDLWLASLGG